ncbi:ABC transporter, permease protein [Gleimia coleocanis DSM 15436]|uniref:ABC transporter, permease protein n=1 Tax=Gleimia coleocanis DSM 15436 TaxID=525245 RepID=C0W1A0_9ACTO|nr:sugar ABC transporter permease [Gleimia coleocanis]EEH63589.1 ABC transporter, permease protein [Gleimia coleocanis DSM 15436]
MKTQSNTYAGQSVLAKWSGTAYVLPSFVILLMIAILPILASAYLSFTQFDVLSSPEWIGTVNYQRIYSDQAFWDALKHTIIFTVFTVPLQIFIPMVLADKLARLKTRWLSGLVRSVLFVPVVASLILVGTVWQYILAGGVGFFNVILEGLGFSSLNFLGDPTLAMGSVIVVAAWKNIGYFLVLFYAGVLDIPKERYEAASVDGANVVQQFFYITIPGLRKVTQLSILLATIWSFQAFDLIYAMTKGGPGGATSTLVMAIYDAGFKLFEMGYASAMAMVLLLLIICFSLIQKLVNRKED